MTHPFDSWLIRFHADDGHFECLSATVPSRQLCLVGDLRLDNAADLKARLGLPAETNPDAVIIAAYRAWGLGFPAELLGDFAFALHDPDERRLILVRDALGVRPLYYSWDGRRCQAGDNQERLLAAGRLDHSLNLSVVGEWCLHGRVHHPTETFFQSLHKVPHAHTLCVDANGLRCQPYWSLGHISPSIVSRNALPSAFSETELIEQLSSLLRQVVDDRLTGATVAIGAHASGGLDSTPIALLAAELAGRRGLPCHGFNWCRPDPGNDPDHYEWSAARNAGSRRGLPIHEIGITAADLIDQLLHHDVSLDGTTTFEYERVSAGRYQELGITTLFSGFGGDEYLTSRTRDGHRRDARTGHWLRLWRHLRLEEPVGTPIWRLGWRFGRRISAAWRDPLQRVNLNTKTGAARRAHNLELIRPGLHSWLQQQNPMDRYFQSDSIHEQQSLMFAVSGYHRERLDTWAILGRRAGLRYVYPLLDRRIVEFAHGLPIACFQRNGRNRYLYRQTISGIVSPEIAQSGKRPELKRVEQLLRARLMALTSDAVLDHIARLESEFVDTNLLLHRIERLRQDAPDLDPVAHKLGIKALFNAVLTLNLNTRIQDENSESLDSAHIIDHP